MDHVQIWSFLDWSMHLCFLICVQYYTALGSEVHNKKMCYMPWDHFVDYLKSVCQNDVWIHSSNIKMIYQWKFFAYRVISQFHQLHIEEHKDTKFCRSWRNAISLAICYYPHAHNICVFSSTTSPFAYFDISATGHLGVLLGIKVRLNRG